jgi:hypothetical protein
LSEHVPAISHVEYENYFHELTATPNDTALSFRKMPASNVNDATLPVEKPVNKLIFDASVLNFKTEQGPDPRLAGSLWITVLTTKHFYKGNR